MAIVKGTRAEDIIKVIKMIPEAKLDAVREITLDFSHTMALVARTCFVYAKRVIDRFHIQQLVVDAVQQVRIKYRWETQNAENEARQQAKYAGTEYNPVRFSNGDTPLELLVRSRLALFKSPDNWSESQKTRITLLFAQFPELKRAYNLSHSLRCIFNKRSTRESAKLNLARWYQQVGQSGFESFNSIATTICLRREEILNYYNNRSTNASAESFKPK